ncbi:MAG TPA: SAM-dependent methyltransferase, partial [Pseudonocardia sp.]|nr:SAM-dependent methyltransferase [Pseudonocardia sp.]
MRGSSIYSWLSVYGGPAGGPGVSFGGVGLLIWRGAAGSHGVRGGRVVAAAGLPFDVVPGVSPSTAVPAYAGVPLGSAHVEADVRAGVDWAALAAGPGPLVLHASAA